MEDVAPLLWAQSLLERHWIPFPQAAVAAVDSTAAVDTQKLMFRSFVSVESCSEPRLYPPHLQRLVVVRWRMKGPVQRQQPLLPVQVVQRTVW